MYLTESDQVIHLRNLPRMLALASRKGTLVIPHRIVPMPMPADYADRPELLNFEKRWHWTHGGAKAKRAELLGLCDGLVGTLPSDALVEGLLARLETAVAPLTLSRPPPSVTVP